MNVDDLSIGAWLKRAAIAAAAAAATLPAAGASAQAGAQAGAEPQAGKVFSLPFGEVPSEIFGARCEPKPGDANFAPSLACFPADVTERPSITVSVADWKSRPTRADMIASMREAFHERRIFKAREEDFAPPGDPDAVGFRAAYQTDLGNRYVWAVLSRGKMIRVVATVFAATDVAAMTADVERKIFTVPRR